MLTYESILQNVQKHAELLRRALWKHRQTIRMAAEIVTIAVGLTTLTAILISIVLNLYSAIFIVDLLTVPAYRSILVA